ncbi:bacterio-opsin activator domain-containing protein [Halococcus sp. IIIV-5B]|uniref:bacterio-opsin activator domain-containing protein n=1 Tax=Halococcus sp. IIIV-5B TaxID=2321230 RepID=UPI000E72AA01|nr:bacterio-opsin activator domain-containing protein [Halococcus sp. IIIV-5B]RJT02582.1 bacterio-opsin activator [Halococcus sp. IIIV-5B]
MGEMAAFLCERGYEGLRRATRTHRADLVVRLCGEVGLRPSEIVAVGIDDLHEVDSVEFLAVDGREAFVPEAVGHALRKYASTVDDGPLIDVSPRRVQMLVRETGERAAEATGDDRFRGVSTRDLRAAHARRLLSDGTDPRVVLAVTAYERLSALEPHLAAPDHEAVAAAFADDGSRAERPPARLQRAVTVAADVGEALAAATEPSAIHETVCARLADTDGYRFAWTATVTGDDTAVHAHAGVAADTVERTLLDRTELVEEALDDRTVRTEAGESSTLVVVPLVSQEPTRSVLGLGVASGAVVPLERDLLQVLGTQVGHALAAVERRRLLLADSVTELRFDVDTEAAVLPRIAAGLDCTFELVGVVPTDEGLLCYVAVRNATPDAVLERATATDAVGDVRFVGDDEDGVVLEVTLHRSPLRTFVTAGGYARSYEVDAGGGTIVGELAPDTDVRGVVEAVADAFPGVHLAAKRKADHEVATGGGFRGPLADDLTDRQAAVLRAAFFGGYFEWPRDSTAEELADSLDVSPPTLHHHLRVAQQKLLRAFLDDT